MTINDLKQFVNELEVNETNQLLKEMLEQLKQINAKLYSHYNAPSYTPGDIYCTTADLEAKAHL